MATELFCRNPPCMRAATRAGLCDPCYVYARRHKGKLRPETLILANGLRQLERQLAAPGWADPIRRRAEARLGSTA